MSGVKGRSGRKSNYECKQLNEILELSAKAVREYLLDPNMPKQGKALLGKDFIIKIIPTQIEAEVDHMIEMITYGEVKSQSESQ
jgi:hypothetical protein